VLQDVSLNVDAARSSRSWGATAPALDDLQDDHGARPRGPGDQVQRQTDHQQEPVRARRSSGSPSSEDRRIFPNLPSRENLRLAALAGREGQWTEKRILRDLRGPGERKDKPAKLSGGDNTMLAIY